MKILFVVPYPTEGASNRMRVEQFIPYLNSKGMTCTVRPFINKRFFRILYSPHHYFEKVFWFIICSLRRILDMLLALKYDIVFIHRESYPFGGPFFELFLHHMKKPIIFDFDDAIFLQNTSKCNIYTERFKKPEKIRRIIEMSDHVVAGNDYLKNYAIIYNKNVTVIPTSIDTDKFCPSLKRASKDKIVI